jgi:hypothetical protein
MKLTKAISRSAMIGLTVLLLGLTAEAQEKKITAKDVPAAVMTAFKNGYPNATIRGYAREKENGKVFYEIESREGTMTRDVLYNPDGNIAEVEESLATTDLPSEVQEAVRKQHPKAVITRAEKTTVGDKITYEISARLGKKKISMEIDTSGKVLSNKTR